jgi:hypothetical protein
MDNADEMTGEEIVKNMDPAAREEAAEELAGVEPGGSEPFRIGDEGPHTELNDDPIDEFGASRQSRP